MRRFFHLSWSGLKPDTTIVVFDRIDLGGTKIEGIVLDGGREVARLRVPTPRDGLRRDAGRNRLRS
jgi:hypothetical protein